MRTKSYFAVPNEVLELFAKREISAYDVRIYAYLCSLRMHGSTIENSIMVTQARIAKRCSVDIKTVSASVNRLYKTGMISDIYINEKPHCVRKYGTSVYMLKPLPESGYFLIPRFVLGYELKPKIFTFYCGFCRDLSFEYGKFWNSYNDIAKRLGYNVKNSHSEILRIVKELTETGLIFKKIRRFRKVFIDNIYRIADFKKQVIDKLWIWNHRTKRAEIYKPNKYRKRPETVHSNIGILPTVTRYFQGTLDCCINF